jgi:hypothetical protein
LAGTWLGSLEYRDFGNGARVVLPTLLTVGRGAGGFEFFYTFDDGGGKVVRDRERVTLDLAARRYVVADRDGGNADAYRIETVDGFAADGAGGTFTALGSGTENGAAVDVRETVTLTPTALVLLRETRPRDSSGDFLFRHRYRFSRLSLAPR